MNPAFPASARRVWPRFKADAYLHLEKKMLFSISLVMLLAMAVITL